MENMHVPTSNCLWDWQARRCGHRLLQQRANIGGHFVSSSLRCNVTCVCIWKRMIFFNMILTQIWWYPITLQILNNSDVDDVYCIIINPMLHTYYTQYAMQQIILYVKDYTQKIICDGVYIAQCMAEVFSCLHTKPSDLLVAPQLRSWFTWCSFSGFLCPTFTDTCTFASWNLLSACPLSTFQCCWL